MKTSKFISFSKWGDFLWFLAKLLWKIYYVPPFFNNIFATFSSLPCLSCRSWTLVRALSKSPSTCSNNDVCRPWHNSPSNFQQSTDQPFLTQNANAAKSALQEAQLFLKQYSHFYESLFSQKIDKEFKKRNA